MYSSAKAEADICCANCGIAEEEIDEVKMDEEECSCKLLRSCSDKCCDEHQEQQEEECQSQVAKVHDDDLLTQPDSSNLGECPLCFLPMPLDAQKLTFKSCCSKVVCNGCEYAHNRSGGGGNCPFCREPTVSRKENKKRMKKRVKANDPAALRQMGTIRCAEGSHKGALTYWTKAAELGDAHAHYSLGLMYWRGGGH